VDTTTTTTEALDMEKLPEIRPSVKLKTLMRFEQHLMMLLRLYNSSYSGDNNQVIQYCEHHLTKMGRTVHKDKAFNLFSPGNSTTFGKAIVAHTDSVGGEEKVATMQSIIYNPISDIIYNNSGRRPMGGDDKVGVAIALTIAELIPQAHVILPADEEVGCVGSRQFNMVEETIPFAIQFDRRGSKDIVPVIGGTKIASKHTLKAVQHLLPHRGVVKGAFTDVLALSERNVVGCAFNMSCGYYNPHDVREYIVYSQAIQSMNDAVMVMMMLFHEDIVPAAKCTEYVEGVGGNYNKTQNATVTPPAKEEPPKELPPPVTETPIPNPSSDVSSNIEKNLVENSAALGTREDNVIIHRSPKGDIRLRIFETAKKVTCALCDDAPAHKLCCTINELVVCANCAMLLPPDDIVKLVNLKPVAVAASSAK
jgi:tripeptide aminopeptidase